MSKNISELSGRQGLAENLFQRYGEISKESGSASKDDLQKLANKFLIGDANTYGAITAYDFMKPSNKGKQIYVCNGSACLCAGTQESVQEQLEKHFHADAIGHMTCLGRCHENGAFHFNGKNYSGNDIAEIDNILDNPEKLADAYQVVSTVDILTQRLDDVESLIDNWNQVLTKKPETILREIKDSNIRGRGGAGFPMGIKWEACRQMDSETKFIICNADEGDPGAFSDRYLLEQHPYKLLFGLMVAGYCTGAHWGVLYIRAEYPEAVEIIRDAVDALKANGALDNQIHPFQFKIIEAKGAYICGEETALINSIEGQRPEVRTRPPYPTVQGLFNKPTVVNNVETLAAVHWILTNGGNEYAKLGTDKSTGTKLICLDGRFVRPGIYEVEMGEDLSKVIYDLGGGFMEPVKALQIGGPLGGIVPVEQIENLTVDFESFQKSGFLLGHASVVAIPSKFPMIKYLFHLMDFAAFESCGKCFPCRIGTTRGKELLQNAINKGQKIDKDLFDDLLHTLKVGSLCAHGGGIPLPVQNALDYFEDELSNYFLKK